MNLVLFKESEIDVPLPKKDARYEHIIKILHKKEGECFDAGIISKEAGRCKILSISKDELNFSFEAQKQSKPVFPLLPIQIIIGFPRPIQLKRILRDVSSLGVEKILLTGADLGEKSYLDSKVLAKGIAETDMLDGCAQARSVEIPSLKMCSSLKDVFALIPQNYDKIVCDISDDSKPLGEYVWQNLGTKIAASCEKIATEKKSGVILAIGSERGWSDFERSLFSKNNFSSYSLGKRILRTESACVASVSVLLSRLGFI